MCGRFYEFSPLQRLIEVFELGEPGFDIRPSYNIAPGQDVLTVMGGEENQLARLRWGLVPSWARDEKIGYQMINARAETVHEKPGFRSAFRKRRCLVVADGFYEWQKTGGTKVPYNFSLKDKQPFGFAGLHEYWKAPDGRELRTCTILTCQANELVGQIHARMPVILPRDKHALWLDSEIDATEPLAALLKPFDADLMDAWEVSTLVNSPSNNEAGLLEPVNKMF